MPEIYHMPKYLACIYGGRYANVHTTYEVDPISEKARMLYTDDENDDTIAQLHILG